MRFKIFLIRHEASIREFVRFGIVGGVSALCLYGVYYLLLRYTNHSVAYTIGYLVSFLLNYLLSIVFTFKVKSQSKKFLGFVLSHIINYTLQIVLLNFFVYIGCSKQWAPLPVLAICVPTNYLIVRHFLKK